MGKQPSTIPAPPDDDPSEEDALAERLVDLRRAPRATVRLDRLRGVRLGPQASFVLSQVDGSTTFEELIDISSMPRMAALRVLCDLLDRGIIR